MQYNSSYIKSQADSADLLRAQPREDQLTQIVLSLEEHGPLPPDEYMQIIGSHDKEHFLSNMRFFAAEILTRCNATRDSSILDIGCGCGRLALPLSHYISDKGRLIGIDVWQDGIDWCKKNITSLFDNCRFHCLPSTDNYYFAEQKGEANDYRLDFVADNSLDIAFGISVFTHLKRADTLAYLRELGRTLKPDGTAYVTCFIIDHFFFDYVRETGKHTGVKESEFDPGCFYAYAYQDFFAGYTMGAWNEMLAESGLWAVCRETGKWANKPGARMYQDTFILGRIRNG